MRFASRRNASTSSSPPDVRTTLDGETCSRAWEVMCAEEDSSSSVSSWMTSDHLRLELFHLAEGLPLRVRAGRVVGVAVAGAAVLRLLADDVKHPATRVPDHELCDGEGGTGEEGRGDRTRERRDVGSWRVCAWGSIAGGDASGGSAKG